MFVDLDVVAVLRAAGCVFAEDEAALLTAECPDPDRLAGLVARRCAGEPLEQLLGWAEFAGLRVAVAPGVFVPRRRTQFLAERAVAVTRPGAVVLDMCCGSGAVAAAITAAVAGVRVHAADIDPAAVECARRNLPGGHVHAGDLYAPLPPDLLGRVDVLVANAPYVPTESIALMPPEARDHEPLTALDGGPDGLSVQRQVIADSRRWLAPGGVVLVETSVRQAPATAAAMAAVGLTATTARSDDLDATVVVGASG